MSTRLAWFYCGVLVAATACNGLDHDPLAPEVTACTDDPLPAELSDTELEIKFAEEYEIRLDASGRLTSRQGRDIKALCELLRSISGGPIRRLIDRDLNRSLASWFRVPLSTSVDPVEAIQMLDARPEVLSVYVRPEPAPPPAAGLGP